MYLYLEQSFWHIGKVHMLNVRAEGEDEELDWRKGVHLLVIIRNSKDIWLVNMAH